MAIFRHILVPSDFSEAARAALRYGLSLALEAEARVTVVHIVPFSPALAYVYPIEGHQVSEEEIADIRQKVVELVAPEHRQATSAQFIVRAGDIEDTLLEVVGEQKPDLVVMGTHGRRRFERWILGSVTEHFLRRTTVPTLTVSHLDETHRIENPVPVPLSKLLYATDLSAESVDGMTRALELAGEFSAEVVILHVAQNLGWALGTEFIPLDLETRTAEARDARFRHLVNSVPVSAREDPRVRIELREGVPFEVILDVAAAEDADMIVLNTQTRSGIDRALLGSTAERVVRGATVPVLSFPGRNS